VFDRPVIGRCQLHKIRNVQDRLPDKLRSVVAARMRRAYHAESALAAEAELCALAAELDKTHGRCSDTPISLPNAFNLRRRTPRAVLGRLLAHVCAGVSPPPVHSHIVQW
jgi:Transposase, Mutator family